MVAAPPPHIFVIYQHINVVIAFKLLGLLGVLDLRSICPPRVEIASLLPNKALNPLPQPLLSVVALVHRNGIRESALLTPIQMNLQIDGMMKLHICVLR